MHLSKIPFPVQFLTPRHRIRCALFGGGFQGVPAGTQTDGGFVADGEGALTRLWMEGRKLGRDEVCRFEFLDARAGRWDAGRVSNLSLRRLR